MEKAWQKDKRAGLGEQSQTGKVEDKVEEEEKGKACMRGSTCR
jgi:hypothetical protein